MYKDYGSNNYDRDIKILKEKYNKSSINKSTMNDELAIFLYKMIIQKNLNSYYELEDRGLFDLPKYDANAYISLRDVDSWNTLIFLIHKHENNIVGYRDILRIGKEFKMNIIETVILQGI